jgi:hypothetical protein
MRVRVRGKCHWGDLVKLHQRERPSSDRTTNDVCTHPHQMCRERNSPPIWGRRLSGPLTPMHLCKASGIPPSTHRRRRFQLIRQRAFHTRRSEEGTRVCGVAPVSVSGFRFRFPFPVSGFRFPISVSGFRFRFPFPVSGFRYPIPPLQS